MTQRHAESTVESRYQRQAALLAREGWDQDKLNNARVAVVGSDALANYAALTLAAFGFGHIELYSQGMVDSRIYGNHKRDRPHDYSGGFLYYEAGYSQPKAKALEQLLHKINPEIDIMGLNLGMQRGQNRMLLGKPTLIIEATNNPSSKLGIIEYAWQNQIPVVSMSAGKHKGGVGIIEPAAQGDVKKLENLLFAEYSGQSQDPIVSQVIGGIGIEEARKIVNPMQQEKPINDMIVYNLLADQRFCNDADKEVPEAYDLKDYSVCLIGAGALGNFVGLGLALRNVGKLTIVDFDVTEVTNLNRQILLYEAVGRDKSIGLAEKLHAINPRPEYRPRPEKVMPESDEFFRKGKFDLIMDTVDNNKTRALLNHFAVRFKIPFISGGTRYNSGQAVIYMPKETGCLNCQADIDNLALGNFERNRQEGHSCIYAAQPSVITSNQITAGLMVGEVPPVLSRERFGDFARGELKFVSNEEYRLSLLPSAVQRCDCHEDKELLEAWHKKMDGVYR